MFRAMFSPIIRSTWLYLQHLILSTGIAAGWCHGRDGTDSSCPLWDNVRKYCKRGRPQMTILYMRIACWIPNSTNTHCEYVILIAFPLQQWLNESASLLRNTYIVCPLVFIRLNVYTSWEDPNCSTSHIFLLYSPISNRVAMLRAAKALVSVTKQVNPNIMYFRSHCSYCCLMPSCVHIVTVTLSS